MHVSEFESQCQKDVPFVTFVSCKIVLHQKTKINNNKRPEWPIEKSRLHFERIYSSRALKILST